ncbi:hypothetical protein PLICRDRAFT_34919 [Plicaturopsis crispa FD-325 SS-3]|nr:hypothetical protein PLICRDRAFT_34919 [Plicaturopsis crispa FD-325 SS-3]
MASPLAARFLTNFMPLSWTPRSGSAAGSSTIPSVSGDDERAVAASFVNAGKSDVVLARESKYVSKGQQLEKLRIRLETEHRAMNGDTCMCKNCWGDIVCL